MTSLGETLRQERTKKNLELGQISRDLKISCRMLAAIEDEKFDRLPGGVFSRSFVRQYARYLGLDEKEIAARLEEVLEPLPPAFGQPNAEAGPSQPQISLSLPIPISRMESWESIGEPSRSVWRSPLTSLGLVVVAIMGCAGVYAWWQRTPHSITAQVTPTTSPATTSPATASPAPAPVPTAPPQQAAEPEVKTATEASISPAVDSNSSASTAPVRVAMTAAEPVWIEIRTDGHITFAGTLAANESRTVDANSTVTLKLGNAGGVSISLNGKPIGNVGGKGQVRNLQLTSGGFEIVPPKSGVSLEDMDL